MLLTAVMLNVVVFLGFTNGVCKFKTHSTYSTYSTCPQKETHFLETPQEHIQHIQHYSRKKHILEKMLLTAVMLNVVVFFLGYPNGVCKFKMHSTYSTYSTYSTFPQKEAHCLGTPQEHIQHIQQFG